jgi:hypothetical protein
MKTYQEFIKNKSQCGYNAGFDPVWMPNFLYDFQKVLVEWSIRKGRSAIFADCGLGKTPMQLVWAENIVRKTGRPVLIIAPLAVAPQTVREGVKFGIEVIQSRDGHIGPGITATNYEQLHRFDPKPFAGVVCDESSAIKQFQGVRRKQVIQFMRNIPYRLMCTATAAPNDYIELGTHSEALGVMGQMDMLSTFFKALDGASHIWCKAGDFWNHHGWVFRAHAEIQFWRWVCSWARALRTPSDIGFDDGLFKLPPLDVRQTVIKNDQPFNGELFPVIARTLEQQREERLLTMDARCQKIAELVNTGKQALVWCHANEEGDLLEKLIKDSVQVAGKDTDEHKENSFLAFADGKIRVLITKPKIGAFGLNFQNCSHMTFFPSHSFEQYYQGTRRCWRFGQKNTVVVDVVTTPGEAGVTANLKGKAEASAVMFGRLVQEMNNSMSMKSAESFNNKMEVPSWA